MVFALPTFATRFGFPQFDSFGIPKPTFKVEDLPDQTGRVFIITGGYGGIGEEIVRVLLLKHATIYIAGRSRSKFDAALSRLNATEEQLNFLELDLGSVKSARFAAAKFLTLESRLDVLINNAGVLGCPDGSRTADGYEEMWGVNVLGHYVFTLPLLPLMESTITMAPNAGFPGRVRIVNLSSAGHQLAPKEGIEWKDNKERGTDNGPWYGGPWTKLKDYGQSKLGNILFTNCLARKHPNILSLSGHPGNISTDLYRSMSIGDFAKRFFLYPADLGALTSLYQALSWDLDLSHNAWYGRPWGRMQSRAQHIHAKGNEKLEDEVWRWCEREAAKH
ncbi:NAD(P)-binding protein [Atractiella rhizophila]|nr:NAD(P)-binding protein [Atractiella rhizophila]